jgi:type VI protein secretion system component Hcp
MTGKSSLSTHSKTLATDSADNLRPLTDSELDLVGGGTKHTDATSPSLLLKCANGKHFAEATT